MEEKLVLAVYNHPVLYDTSLNIYRNNLQKNDAWKAIAELVGVNGGFIKNIYFLQKDYAWH